MQLVFLLEHTSDTSCFWGSVGEMEGSREKISQGRAIDATCGVPKKPEFPSWFVANHGANGWTWCKRNIANMYLKYMYEVFVLHLSI